MIALTKGWIALCLVTVSTEEVRGFMEPFAVVAIAVPIVRGGALGAIPDVGNRRLQGQKELGQRRAERWFSAVVVQPVAGFAEPTMAASRIAGFEIATVVAIGEIDLSLDQPARVLEQGHEVPRDRSRAGTRQCGHGKSVRP